jgi:hypothetical protein
LGCPYAQSPLLENVALIQPSQGSERVFAMATNIFDEPKASTSEDRKEGTMMIRMNQNWRQSEIKQLSEDKGLNEEFEPKK